MITRYLSKFYYGVYIAITVEVIYFLPLANRSDLLLYLAGIFLVITTMAFTLIVMEDKFIKNYRYKILFLLKEVHDLKNELKGTRVK